MQIPISNCGLYDIVERENQELFSMDYKSIMVQPFCVRAGYLLQSHGYANPLEVIGRLFLQLRPHLVAVIFHGGPDFVHLYASEWISTYVDADPISPPLILFSDNLSGRAKVKGTTDSLFI